VRRRNQSSPLTQLGWCVDTTERGERSRLRLLLSFFLTPNGRYFKHGVVSRELSDNWRYFERSIAWCIALVQVQDADGL